MQSSVNYIIRSLQDGKYLVARIQVSEDLPESSYLLVFKDLGDRLTVESISSNQLKGLLQRWGYRGIGLVKDPLLPEIDFLTQE
jgi:hypothetical protein